MEHCQPPAPLLTVFAFLKAALVIFFIFIFFLISILERQLANLVSNGFIAEAEFVRDGHVFLRVLAAVWHHGNNGRAWRQLGGISVFLRLRRHAVLKGLACLGQL